MTPIQVIDSTYLVPLPAARRGQARGAIMVGSPPEALKVLVGKKLPAPSILVLPPDPLFVDGINQASFEFLLFNHLFVRGGLRDRIPFTVVCDPQQQPRIQALVRQMLRGPSDEQMSALRTPAAHRRMLLRETSVVSGDVATHRVAQMAQVVAFEQGEICLSGGIMLRLVGEDELEIEVDDKTVRIPRRAQIRTPLPLFFADVHRPVKGPRFGLQIIGSASGFSASEWSSCFIAWINGQPLLIDGTPYMEEHLSRLGIEDAHILGYLITHNHEDHANLIGQLVGRRRVTVLTSAPVMAGLIERLAAILDHPREDVPKLMNWVPLQPGLDAMGPPLDWFGAEIRTWYSVHTIPTLGVDISMGGRRMRLPGDTLWGRQMEPLLEQKVVSPSRFEFIQHTYDGADVIVADAGGGPIHPDPSEVQELLTHSRRSRLLVTHLPERLRGQLPVADPGTVIDFIPRPERTADEAMGLFSSPLCAGVPERWLLALLFGGEVEHATSEEVGSDSGFAVLTGSLVLEDREDLGPRIPLQRGDFFHPELMPDLGIARPRIQPAERWTRILRLPEPLYRHYARDTGAGERLHRLYRTRRWWQPVIGIELGLDSLVTLAGLCRELTYPAGEEIVRQEDPANHFYVVTHGKVRVERTEGSRAREAGDFGPGYHFGEIGLLDEEVRIATIRALEEVRVLQLPSRAFRRHLMDIPLARYGITREARTRRRELLGEEEG